VSNLSYRGTPTTSDPQPHVTIVGKGIITPLSPENFKKLRRGGFPRSDVGEDEKKIDEGSYGMRDEPESAKKVQPKLETEVSPKGKRGIIHAAHEELPDSFSIERNKIGVRAVEKERYVDGAGKRMRFTEMREMKD
jgi:hypothetical protein